MCQNHRKVHIPIHTHPQKLVFLYIFHFILPAAWVGISLSSCQSINQRYKRKTLGCLGSHLDCNSLFFLDINY